MIVVVILVVVIVVWFVVIQGALYLQRKGCEMHGTVRGTNRVTRVGPGSEPKESVVRRRQTLLMGAAMQIKNFTRKF